MEVGQVWNGSNFPRNIPIRFHATSVNILQCYSGRKTKYDDDSLLFFVLKIFNDWMMYLMCV